MNVNMLTCNVDVIGDDGGGESVLVASPAEETSKLTCGNFTLHVDYKVSLRFSILVCTEVKNVSRIISIYPRK